MMRRSGGPQLTRREIVTGAAGALLLCGSRARAQEARTGLPPYCAVDSNIDLTRYRARSSTGDKRLDRALIAEFKSITRIMPVNPGFRIIDDAEAPNAFAMNRTVVPNTQGTVLFGINLLQQELNSESGGYAAAGIGAHECAHIYQFFTDFGPRLMDGQATTRALELHADLRRVLPGGQ